MSGVDVCKDPQFQAAFRLHSEADIEHDSPGKLKLPGMNLARILGYGPDYRRPQVELNEDTVMSQLIPGVVFKPERLNDTIHFQTSTITDGFVKPFDPFSGENSLNFRDAGPVLPLGLNGVTGPSAIDPANRTVGDMVAYSYEPDIYIPGCFFGLDERYVRNILLRRFRASATTCHVQCGIQYRENPEGPFVWIDMTSTESGPNPDVVKTPKFINRPSGYLAGNGGNAKLKNGPKDIPYYIGKLLGDALQVYILLPFAPRRANPDGPAEMVPNPAYPISKQLNTGMPVSYLFLSTLDRLEYVRAVMLGLAVTYVGPKDHVTKIREGKFVPGFEQSKTDEELYSDFYKRLETCWKTIMDRYEDTIASLQESLRGGQFNTRYSMMGGVEQVTSDKVPAATAVITAWIGKVIAVRDWVSGTIAPLGAKYKSPYTPELLKDIRTDYIVLNSKIASLSPAGRMINGKPNAPTGNVKQKLKILSTETDEIVIDFMRIFQDIKAGRPHEVAPWTPGPQSVVIGGMRGGYDLAALPYSWPGMSWSSQVFAAYTHQIYSDNARALGYKRDGTTIPSVFGRYWEVEQKIASALPIGIVPPESIKQVKDLLTSKFPTSGFRQLPSDVSDPWTWEDVCKSSLSGGGDLMEFIEFLAPKLALNDVADGYAAAFVVLNDVSKQPQFIEDQILFTVLFTSATSMFESMSTPPIELPVPQQVAKKAEKRGYSTRESNANRTALGPLSRQTARDQQTKRRELLPLRAGRRTRRRPFPKLI
jgi:hypothetical protein